VVLRINTKLNASLVRPGNLTISGIFRYW